MLNKRESDIVAVLTADFRNPFQPALIEALTEGLCTDGLIPLLLKANSVDERADGLIQLALSYRVSAIIVTVLSASAAVIKRCVDSHVPVLVLNRLVEDTAAICVATDSERGASRIAEVLVEGGKSRIAMITGKTGSWTNSMRRSGFRRRLDELGFDVMASQPGEFTYDGGRDAAESLLTTYPRLDAIYACNDAMAFGALDAIRRLPSQSVPKDVAVIGFDDVPISAWGAYRLSTIRQPIGSLIEHIRDILRRGDRGLGLAGQTFLHEGCFVQRATTNPVLLRAGDIDLSAATERAVEKAPAAYGRLRTMG
jgi:DNA-binding LacI/PurR family transcriptional regulator